MKADIQADQVVFRGAIKQSVPFSALEFEVRGTLLTLMWEGNTVDLAAGSKAQSIAKRLRAR